MLWTALAIQGTFVCLRLYFIEGGYKSTKKLSSNLKEHLSNLYQYVINDDVKKKAVNITKINNVTVNV